VRGYEYVRDQYVTFTDAELDQLQAQANSDIELQEFIPSTSVDPVYLKALETISNDQKYVKSKQASVGFGVLEFAPL